MNRLGVEIMKGVMVTDINGQGVTYKHGDATSKLAAKTVLWAGGVDINSFGKQLGKRTRGRDRQGWPHQGQSRSEHSQLS